MAATVSAKTVRELCTAPEAELVRASRDRSVSDVSISKLRTQRDRARTLRDKFRALAERQRREARGKQGPRGATASKSNDRTVVKQQIFAEAVEKFEQRIAKVEAKGGGASTARASRTRKESIESAKRSDRQSMRKKLRIETKSTDRPLAKRAGKGSAGASSAGTRPVRASSAATADAKPAKVLKKKAVAPRSLLGRTASKASTKVSTGASTGVTSIPLNAESVLRAGDLDPMSIRTPEVAARSSHLVLDRSARIERTGAVKIQAHIGSRNRRNQAKRDSAG